MSSLNGVTGDLGEPVSFKNAEWGTIPGQGCVGTVCQVIQLILWRVVLMTQRKENAMDLFVPVSILE